jgi:O-antigen ligase
LSVLLIGGVFFFPSRSGLISAVVGATVFCFLRWGRTALSMGAAGICGAVTLLSADQVAQFLKMQDALSFRRKDIWTSALRGIMEKPWGGWGPGQFETLYQHHAIPQDIGPVRLNIFTAYAHNDYLQLASEYGVPLALFFLGGVGYYFWQRRWKTSFLSGFSAALAGGAFCAFNHPLAFPMNAPLCVACSLRPIGDFEHAGDLCRACYLEALPLPSPRPPRPTRPDSTPSPGSGRTISY